MTRHEFKRCKVSACYANLFAEKKPLAIWPKAQASEGRWFLWRIYVEWSPGKRGNISGVKLCSEHHEVMVALWQDEKAQELREEEANEAWLIKTKSRM